MLFLLRFVYQIAQLGYYLGSQVGIKNKKNVALGTANQQIHCFDWATSNVNNALNNMIFSFFSKQNTLYLFIYK